MTENTESYKELVSLQFITALLSPKKESSRSTDPQISNEGEPVKSLDH